MMKRVYLRMMFSSESKNKEVGPWPLPALAPPILSAAPTPICCCTAWAAASCAAANLKQNYIVSGKILSTKFFDCNEKLLLSNFTCNFLKKNQEPSGKERVLFVKISISEIIINKITSCKMLLSNLLSDISKKSKAIRKSNFS